MYPILILLVKQLHNWAGGTGLWFPISCPVYRWSEGDLLCLAE